MRRNANHPNLLYDNNITTIVTFTACLSFSLVSLARIFDTHGVNTASYPHTAPSRTHDRFDFSPK